MKRLLNRSGHKSVSGTVPILRLRSAASVNRDSSLLRIGAVPGIMLCLLLLISCTPKRVEIPLMEGVALKERLSGLGEIRSIEAALEVDYEKNGGIMRGDGALKVSEDNLTLRMYYRGFMVGEITEERGIVKSNPKLNQTRSAILVYGLRSGFLWWDIKDYTVEENGDVYMVKNYNRKLAVDKKTLLPLRQTVELESGETLDIYYDSPAKAVEDEEGTNGLFPVLKIGDRPLWYQSGLKIEIGKNTVKVKIKSYGAYR